MRFNQILPAVIALGATVKAQSDDDSCSEDITIRDNNPTINCEVVRGDITVDESVAGELNINGPEEIRGNLIVNNVTGLISLSSSTISSINGRFELQDLTLLSNLQFSSLRSVEDLVLARLAQLGSLTFGTTGVTRASTIRISDTHISDLSGLRIATVDSLQIDNNDRLVLFSSDLVNITDTLQIIANGNDNMTVEMNQLETAAEIQISNVANFEVPALTEVSASLKFENNPQLSSFSAPNLTEIAESLTFNNNRELRNISFPVLTSSGDLTVENNANLIALEGFPELTRIEGGVRLAGNFESVEIPELSLVTGGVNVTSSTDIEEFCEFFDDAKSRGDIRGEEECTSEDPDAIGEEADGGSGSGSGSDDDDDEDAEDAAGIVGVNMAVLTVAVLAGLTQLL
ncbi:hypothetical protein S7711_00001 [Stachybotrys chartarum IBT 7711]|uniref:Receptor L-domain domain-containing protein n=1 Tax=Stachybotrys chartarum (strain CBS 109288 / IBT 7711) TaxID=1280523 RepID=A0A084B352_STACB|nr:hypothetical protein S7711_00001 [Stachybotrys chartarum IBT 7711]KFA49791.1 hypothetical protein S40293_08462 [Stachybotrys chartarum IBT 40293]